MKVSLIERAVIAVALVAAGVSLADSIDSSRAVVRVTPMAPAMARAFNLHDVRVLGGPFKDGQDIAVKWVLSLEADRFLARFRQEAGLEARAEHYGGWERQGVSGHSCGHYLSACALGYAATGDRVFLERVNYVVSELAACQKAQGDGYVGAIPNGRQVYGEVAAGNIRSSGFDLNGCWVPNYTMHKLFAGLRDAYRLGGNRQALEVAMRLGDWFERIHGGLTDEQMQRVLVAEHGGLNETFADLYADTGEERYLALARRFHHKAILDPLARQEDILAGKHANTQIPKLTGLATLYELDGRASDRLAAEFFWERVVNHHSYVTGGHCDHEYFGAPDQLNDRLSPATTETCNVYNTLKLTRHVFGWKPEAAVADFNERALLNHVRAAQHPDGRVIYNLSLQPGHHKEYQLRDDGWTCCMGTGMEMHLRYGESIYFNDDDGVWVNLFIPSEVTWRERGVRLRQETRFPDGDIVNLTVMTARAEPFTLRVRHPHWATGGMEVTVNDEVQRLETSPSSYAKIRRTWANGDRVTLKLAMSLRTESMPDNSKRVAIFYGPTLLAADLGAVDDPKANEPGYVPVLVTEGRAVNDWVERCGPLLTSGATTMGVVTADGPLLTSGATTMGVVIADGPLLTSGATMMGVTADGPLLTSGATTTGVVTADGPLLTSGATTMGVVTADGPLLTSGATTSGADDLLRFRTVGVGRGRDVELLPFFRLHDRRYTVYLDVFTEDEWERREADVRAEQERQRLLAARTLDELRIGEMQPERDHELQGEKTSAGEAFGRKWRHAVDGGWFAFRMKVEPGKPAELLCTYWGGDGGRRIFDVLVEGERIATQQLERNAPNRFFDVSYSIPVELTRGRDRVTIRFQAHDGAMAGGLFGARLLRVEEGR